jgi:hypothetical protein
MHKMHSSHGFYKIAKTKKDNYKKDIMGGGLNVIFINQVIS